MQLLSSNRLFRYRLIVFISLLFCCCYLTTAAAQQMLKPVPQLINRVKASEQFQPVTIFSTSQDNEQRASLPVTVIAPDAWFLTLNTKTLNQAVQNNYPNIILKIPVSATRTFTLELTQAQILTDDFFVSSAKGRGIETHEPYCPGLYYRGIIQGDVNSIAAISLFEGEIMGVIANNEGNFTLGKLKNKVSDYVIYNDHNLTVKNPFTCATPDDNENQNGTLKNLPAPVNTTLNPEALLVCDKVVKVYIQCDYDMYQDFSNSTVNVTNHTTGLYNVVAALYANETINTQISQIYVWTVSDPYPDNSSGSALDAFGSQVGTSFNGNLAHLFSTNNNGLGGIAWLDVLCSSSRHAYSNISTTYQSLPTYSWSVNCVTHEMGHNLGSPHTHSCSWAGGAIDNCYAVEGSCSAGPAPTNGGTIMSYCHLSSTGINFNNGFGTLPGNLIRSRVTAATCLTSDFAGASTTGNTSICSGSNVQITATPTGSGYTYQWKLNGSNISGATSSSYNAGASGNYTVQVVSAQGCTSVSSQVAVAVISGQPSAIFTYGSAGTSTTFSNTSTNANAYSWNFGDPASGANNTSTLKNPIHTFSAPGDYTVSLTAINNCVTPNLQNVSSQIITIQAYNPCSGTTNITDCTGTITDGSAGQNYSNNQSCSWLISPTGAETVTLTFTAFNTESDYDFVKVYDGTSASATLLGSYSGSSLPPTINSSGPSLFVTFISDTYVTGTGFDANYACVLPVLCSGGVTLNNCSGTISDGSGTSNYANNMNCSWLISPPDGLPIALTFLEFATQSASDQVRVYNGTNASGALLGTFSGTSLPSVVTASSGYMYLEFSTDASGTAAGWKATYACVPQTCGSITNLTTCSGNISDGSGSNNYPNNLNCTWLIAPTGATSISLTFTSFNTEAGYDFVKVYDGSSTAATLLGSYSGTTLPPTLNSSGGTLFIQFNSDASVVSSGWSASYNCTTPGAELFFKALLQGPYSVANSNMNTTLAAGSYISNTQPFNRPPWNYNGTESVASVASNTVDWVLLDLLNASYVVQGRRAAFLRQDGVLVDLDGSQGVVFNGLPAGNYYVVVRSRNHIPIMSDLQVTLPNSGNTLNLISAANVRYGSSAMAEVSSGKYALIAGDCIANGVISFADFNSFFLQAGFSGGYFDADCNLDGSVNNTDFTIYTNNTGKMAPTQIRY